MEFMSYIMITIYTMDIIFVAVSVTLNDAGSTLTSIGDLNIYRRNNFCAVKLFIKTR